MVKRQLITIRDSMKKIVSTHGDKLSNDTKVDFDDTINFLDNIIIDVEKEVERGKQVVNYMLVVELN